MSSTKNGAVPYESGTQASAGALLPLRYGARAGAEWLKGLEADEKKVLGVGNKEDIKEVEFSWPIGMPLLGSLGRELW